MKLCFDSVDELKAFVKNELKGTRRGRGDDDEGSAGTSNQAPQPIMPTQPQAGFAQQSGGGFGGMPGAGFSAHGGPSAFPAAGASPEVTALVQRVNTAIDKSIASGQSVEAVLNWFRTRCGAEAAAATLDQIKTVYLPKQSVAHLEETAKLMGV
jgi:hypothetical protein